MKVGLQVPIHEDDQRGSTPPYHEIRERMLKVEADGFDAIWLYDHLFFRHPNNPTTGIWECWTLLSAIAEATKRIELGTLVMCTPFRNPALLAKMAVTVDAVSGGRFTLGVGAGWHQPEFDAFGFPFDHKVDRFEEALQIMVPLLKEGKANFEGKYYSVSNCELRPRGPRPEGPPLLIASFKPRMLQLTAQYADVWNTAWLGDPKGLAKSRAALEAACVEVGRDPATLPITVGLSIAYPDLGEVPAVREKYVSGSAEEVAQVFKAYEQLGVSQVICSCAARVYDQVEPRLAQALHVYQQMVG